MRDAENPLACFLRKGGSDSPALLMKRKTAHVQKLAPRKHPEGFRKRNRKATSSDTIPCTPFAFRKDPEGFRKKNRKGNKPRTKLASRKLPEAQPEELPEGNRHAPGLFQRFCLGQPCCVSSFAHLYVPALTEVLCEVKSSMPALKCSVTLQSRDGTFRAKKPKDAAKPRTKGGILAWASEFAGLGGE